MTLSFPKDVDEASKRITPYIHKTYFNYSPTFSKLIKGQVNFKLENLQVTGSFKVRGAMNRLLALSEDDRSRGVIAASTGNHGAAVAYAAKRINIPCSIYVPKGSSVAKLKNMEQHGAIIHPYGTDCIDSELKARETAFINKQIYVSPYNDPLVIAGQGTIGFEIKAQCERLDTLIIAVGGGGLIGGIASYLKLVWPNMDVIGCSPKNSAVMIHSLEKGELLDLESTPTLSDGTAGGVEKDSITFPICQDVIDKTILVTEEEIKDGMLRFLENEHLLLEGAAGTAIAALLKMKDNLKHSRVGVVICGGNISLETLKKILH